MANQSGEQTFSLPTADIDFEVISADIGIYVGRTARVRLDQHQGRYLICAQDRPTTEMIADMKADSLRWQTERLRYQAGSRYVQSATHRERAAYGPTPPNASYRRRPSREEASYGSLQSQSAYGGISSRANIGAIPEDLPLSRQSTADGGDGRINSGFAPISRTSSHVDSYGGTGQTPTSPIPISGWRQRTDSFDSMYGFARSPIHDDLRSPPNTSRREQQWPPSEYDRRWG